MCFSDRVRQVCCFKITYYNYYCCCCRCCYNSLQMFTIAKNTIAKDVNGYIVIIVVMNFYNNFSITQMFSMKFPGMFPCNKVPVCV